MHNKIDVPKKLKRLLIRNRGEGNLYVLVCLVYVIIYKVSRLVFCDAISLCFVPFQQREIIPFSFLKKEVSPFSHFSLNCSVISLRFRPKTLTLGACWLDPRNEIAFVYIFTNTHLRTWYFLFLVFRYMQKNTIYVIEKCLMLSIQYPYYCFLNKE